MESTKAARENQRRRKAAYDSFRLWTLDSAVASPLGPWTLHSERFLRLSTFLPPFPVVSYRKGSAKDAGPHSGLSRRAIFEIRPAESTGRSHLQPRPKFEFQISNLEPTKAGRENNEDAKTRSFPPRAQLWALDFGLTCFGPWANVPHPADSESRSRPFA